MISFECRTTSRATVQRMFDLSLDIDAHRASLPGSAEEAVAGITSGQIGLGETVTWKARHFGIWFTMTSRIVALEPGRSFVDEQQSGPFKAFRHVHLFEELPDGGCLMTDQLAFTAPFGPIGRLAERLVLGRYLPHLIDERNAYLVRVAEDPSR